MWNVESDTRRFPAYTSMLRAGICPSYEVYFKGSCISYPIKNQARMQVSNPLAVLPYTKCKYQYHTLMVQVPNEYTQKPNHAPQYKHLAYSK